MDSSSSFAHEKLSLQSRSLPHRPHRRSCSENSMILVSPRLGLHTFGVRRESTDSTTQMDSPFGPLSPDMQDRVFPIRSVVSVDPRPTPPPRNNTGGDGFPGLTLPPQSTGTGIDSLQKAPAASESQVGSASDTLPGESPSTVGREAHVGNSHQEQDPTGNNFGHGNVREDIGSATTEAEREGGSRMMHPVSDMSSAIPTSQRSRHGGIASRDSNASIQSSIEGIVTARFEHVITDEGHAVITGRGGETLQRCEDEPIHIPGAVQGFGVLIALQEVDDKLIVRIASENSKRIMGYSPNQLFALANFYDILPEEQAGNMLDHLDSIRDADIDPANDGPAVFTLSMQSPTTGRTQKLWCAMHLNINNRDLVICEFEPEDDPLSPLTSADELTPEKAEDTLQSSPTPEELAESTINSSRPLRALRSARKSKGEAATMEMFNIMSQVQSQLDRAPTLAVFLKVLVGMVKELTGFHRVMVYQFDKAWNGKVVTELVDPRATKDLYKGLNFPASDIPKQARDLYRINKVRLLYDRDQETARLVCRSIEDLETPLDMTHANLRAMSPIHIKYLANMAVRSSMSISINAFDELWGLIACHAYGANGVRVSFPIRKMCRMVGESASHNIERFSYASRLQARKLINTVPTAQNPSGYIIASSDDLLSLFDADYGLLSIRQQTKIMGQLDSTQEALVLLEYLRLRKITTVLTSQDINNDFPDMLYPPGLSLIAGLLLVPLSATGSDFIVFFRRSQTREVKWAGNPYEKFIQKGTEGFLEPRKSFKTWSETIVGKSRDWTEEQIETAGILCLVYGKFIEVWRQKEAVEHSSQLTRLLLSNSAHEVRTPLNAIINYLEIAMEGALDPETRENLSKSHSASKSLIYVINDLLDLTKTEEGNNLFKDDIFDLPATVKETSEMFKGDAKRKQITYEFVQHPGVPQYVTGDQRRVHQAISNLIANAIQHAEAGFIKVEIWLVEAREDQVAIDIVVQDTGRGMSPEKLDMLFRQLEQVQSEADGNIPEALTSPDRAVVSSQPKKQGLGLGLAVVARIVGNMNGQLRLKSEEGKGSRFVIQFTFGLPRGLDNRAQLAENSMSGIASPAARPATPPITEGEVVLVSKSPGRPSSMISHRTSFESLESIMSGKSSKGFKSGGIQRSDQVDRLMDAIQESHTVGNAGFGSDGHLTGPPSRLALALPQLSDSSTSGVVSSESQELDADALTHSALPEIAGQTSAVGQKTAIIPVRVLNDDGDTSVVPLDSIALAPLIPCPTSGPTQKQIAPPNADKLNILVAEDDPINSKIMKKRLEKIGHAVHLTGNGEECANAYADRVAFFDVVLMDMQMPIVDGLTSTKMIRSFEKTHPEAGLSDRAALNGRVPIFAVSASLIEKELDTYVKAGFDGWILKPVDFQRLGVLFDGIVEEITRKECLYVPGEWERGGWFPRSQPSESSASTKPDSPAVLSSPPIDATPTSSGSNSNDPISKEQDRLEHLDTDAVHAPS